MTLSHIINEAARLVNIASSLLGAGKREEAKSRMSELENKLRIDLSVLAEQEHGATDETKDPEKQTNETQS